MNIKFKDYTETKKIYEFIKGHPFVLNNKYFNLSFNCFIGNMVFVYDWDNDKVGLIDLNGNEIIPCEYYANMGVSDSNNLLLVCKEEKGPMGAINLENKIVIPFEYEALLASKNGLISATKCGLWGCIDSQNKIIIPIQYENLLYLTKELTGAKKNKLWGIINNKNEIVIPFEYEEFMMCNNGLIAAKKDGLWGVIDKQNKTIIPFDYKKIGAFKFQEGIVALENKEGLWGFVNEQNEVIIPFKYGSAVGFCDGLACVYDTQIKKYGAIDIHNNIVIPFAYESMIFSSIPGLINVGNNGKYWEINHKNEIVIPQGTDSQYIGSELISVCNEEGLWGLYDSKGNLKLPFEYIEILKLSEDSIRIVNKEHLMGIAKYNGSDITNVFPCKYKDLWDFVNDYDSNYNFYAALEDEKEKHTIIDDTGRKVITYKDVYCSDVIIEKTVIATLVADSSEKLNKKKLEISKLIDQYESTFSKNNVIGCTKNLVRAKGRCNQFN